ncbi:hypothetical protein HK098_008276 [Nowakowskiella sp. JEL0407]|nr:hypothetical protein HK098_008276 [Nowakowskiella sp. JEL0407]
MANFNLSKLLALSLLIAINTVNVSALNAQPTPTASAAKSASSTSAKLSGIKSQDATVPPISFPVQIAFSSVLILTGAYMLLAARRYFFVMCAISGVYLWGMLAYATLSAFETAITFQSRDLIYIVTLVVVCGAGGGGEKTYFFGPFFLLTKETSVLEVLDDRISIFRAYIRISVVGNGLIKGNLNGDPTVPLRFLLEVALSIMFYILIFYHDRYIGSFGSAFVGAFAIGLGVDTFMKTGFQSAVLYFMGGSNAPPQFTTSVAMYAMLGAIIGGGLVGGVIQLFVTAPLQRDYASPEDEEENEAIKRSGTLHKKPIRMGSD